MALATKPRFMALATKPRFMALASKPRFMALATCIGLQHMLCLVTTD